MSTVLHVDLGLSGSGFAGTDLNPYSWLDVKNWLTGASTSGFDVEFRMRGTGDLLGNAGMVALDGIDFTANQKLVFTSDDVRRYGLPVITANRSSNATTKTTSAIPLNGTFLSISNCLNLNIEFCNCILDVDSVNACTVIGIDNVLSSKIKFYNNIVLSRRYLSNVGGASTTLLDVTNAGNSSQVAIGFNTVMVNSQSSSTPRPLFKLGSSVSGWFGGNYVARHNNNSYYVSVVDVDASSTLKYGGNCYGGDSNTITPYVGNLNTRISTGDADVNCNYATQGVFNDTLFDGAEAYSGIRTSSFWPVHGGLLLNTCPNLAAHPNYALGTESRDALGFLRVGYDAGAFEKNHNPTTQTYHVDLNTAGYATEQTGQTDSPYTLQEMLRIYSRLAPVVDDVKFVLRGDNSAFSALPSWDLGPLSPNPSATETRFTGTGSITITGYRTQILTPPYLRVNRLTPRATCKVVFEKIKLDWDSGTDLVVSDTSTDCTGVLFVIRNSVIRTGSSCVGKIVNNQIQGTGLGTISGPNCLILGNIVQVRHTTGTSGGLFGMNAGDNVLSLNTVIVPSGVTDIGTSSNGTTQFKGNYLNISGAWTFAGAVLAHNTQSSSALTDIFVDPLSAFITSSWKFTGLVSQPLDVISSDDLPIEARTNCDTDIRDLRRDASPSGSPTYDAGPYEYSYFVPPTRYIYADLARIGSGHAGSLNDRWSYVDIQNFLNGFNNAAIKVTEPYEISCINTANNAGSLILHDIEATPTGSVRIRSENPFALAQIDSVDSTPWLSVSNAYGFTCEFDSMIARSQGYLPLIELTGYGQGSSVRAFNTVLWHKDTVGIQVVDATLVQSGTTITVAGIVKTFGTDIAIPTGADANAVLTMNTVNAFNADSLFTAVYNALVLASGVVGFTSTVASPVVITVSTLGITVYDSTTTNACVSIGATWDFVGIGCGVASVVDPGCQARTVSGFDYAAGSTGVVAYSGFSGTLGANYGVRGNTTVLTSHNAVNGYSTAMLGTTDTGSILSGNKIALNATTESFVVTDFTATGAALNIVQQSSLAAGITAFGIDYDILRGLRAEASTDYYDAGPVEANAITSTSGFMDPAETLIAGLTSEGYSLNCRRDVDGLSFKVVGYAVGSCGYLRYNPSKVIGYAGSGLQAIASVTLSSNTFDALSQVSISIPVSTVITKAYNDPSGWAAGSTTAATCLNIARSFRQDADFNTYCYCTVVDSTIYFYAKLFGVVGNTYDLSSTVGTAVQFHGGTDSLGVINKVWPETSPYVAFDRFETPDESSCSMVARLDLDQCNKPIGQIAIIAEVLDSPIASEIDTLYVYAFANTPLHVKHNREVVVKRVLFQF